MTRQQKKEATERISAVCCRFNAIALAQWESMGTIGYAEVEAVKSELGALLTALGFRGGWRDCFFSRELGSVEIRRGIGQERVWFESATSAREKANQAAIRRTAHRQEQI